MIKRTLKHVWSPQLRNRRDVDVYLPASYASGVRYPVVYMKDGQNLSDPATAFAGTWDLEATIDRLAWRGVDAIYVGVHHAGRRRLAEYSPFPGSAPRRRRRRRVSGLPRRHAEAAHRSYVQHAARSRRDGDLRLVDGRPRSASTRSSATQRCSRRAGVMSPSIWFGQGAIVDFVAEARAPRGRIYLDVGTGEGVGTVRDVRRLGRLLVSKGFRRRRRPDPIRHSDTGERRSSSSSTVS